MIQTELKKLILQQEEITINNNYNYCFLFSFILSQSNTEDINNIGLIAEFTFKLLILNIISLYCFIILNKINLKCRLP